MERKTYYVNMQGREISQIKYQNNHHYKINATDDEVRELRRLFDQVHAADMEAYWRTHIPFVPYHRDLGNDRYDEAFTEALQLIYQLGDENTRMYIDTTGVLSDNSLQSKRT